MATTFTTPDWRKNFANETQAKDNENFGFSKQSVGAAANKAIEGQLAGQTPGFDVQANEARESFKTAQAFSQKNIRENLMGQGLKDTGAFVQEGVINPEREQLRQRMQLERQLSSDRAGIANQNVQAGIQGATNLLGLKSQEDIAAENRKSSEKIAFAGLSLDESRLAQDAMQFNDKMSFDRWATQAGLDDNAANRIWQATESEKMRSFTKDESVLDRALTKEVEEGRINVEQAKMAQQMAMFTDEMAFNKWAKDQDIDQAAATRLWQEGQNELNRVHDQKMQQLRQDFEEKGIAFDAVLQSLESMDGAQAWGVVKEMAAKAGIDIPDVEMPTASETVQTGDFSKLSGPSDPAYQEIVNNPSNQWANTGYYETSGNNQQNFSTHVPKTGNVISMGGKAYKVTSDVMTNKTTGAHKEYQYFTVEDVLTGETYQVKPKGLRSEEYGADVLNV